MAWNPLTADAFRDKLTKAEYTAITSIAVQDGKTWADVLDEEITRTANLVRGYTPNNTPQGTGETIPDELQDAALAVLRMKFFTRLPALKGLWSEARNQEYLQAIDLLRDWAGKRFRVVPPEDAAPTQAVAGAAAAKIIPDPRAGDKQHTNGL